MTHKPGHKTSPHYDKLTPAQKKRYNKATAIDFWEKKQGDGAAK